ncbi:MAG: hypothetical protein E7592_00620 [Ruminococcaceae bacterium]|nr:hypothetical protein [Oscillospiraceae bacterium]
MKSTKRIVCIILAIATLLGAVGIGAAIFFVKDDVDPIKPLEEIPYSESMTPSVTPTGTSFFEDTFLEVDPEKGEHINITYDEFPRTQNTSNLLSQGTAVFEIDGKTVMADAYYRVKDEALNDPNAGLGILLYQSILYKIANPEAEMRICFTSYRISPTAAVCVLPQSRYYGYMRSLYGNGNDYDQNGFVRIIYMLVEAAKMGIDVTVIGQLNSYAVKQYNSKGELKKVAEASYAQYLNNALSQDCYDKYADGKKVSDFMTFREVEWTLEDKGGTDMMHLKSLTTSNYLDRDGVAHENAVFFSSANMDAIDYKGCNGNNGSQSGVTITGHKEIYNATVNYIDLMAEYYEQEKLYELRYLLQKRNTEQAELIGAGRENEIPDEEQITWLGSEGDKVFKLYFSCLGGDYDAWNTVTNPYCEQVQNLYDSAINYPDEYRVFTWNCASYTRSFNVSQIMDEMVNRAFIDYPHPDNRLSIMAKEYEYDELSELKVGTDIGFLKLKNKSTGMHSKDLMFSYVKDGERKYVSLLSSCNFHSGALYYQTNSMLTITETDETGDTFYKALGIASTAGCIVEEGKTFSTDERLAVSKEFGTLPQTVEAVFELNENAAKEDESYGMLLSNHDYWHSQLSVEVAAGGNPQVTFWINESVPDETSVHGDKMKCTKLVFLFDKVDVRSYKETRLTIVHDREKAEVRCYVNGELKQTLTQESIMTKAQIKEGVSPITDFETTRKFVVGGSWMGSNGQCFKGVLKELNVWADVRSTEEIAAEAGTELAGDEDLLVAYNFRKNDKNSIKDLSANKNDLKTEVLWQDVSEVEDVGDFAYSFAIVGDIQELSEDYFNDHYFSDKGKDADGNKNGKDPYDDEYVDEDTDPLDNKPEHVKALIDWLLENKEEHKIEYVMTLGDLTQKSYTAEWDYVRSQFYRLDGIVPFSLARGNHDKVEPQIKTKDENNQTVWPDELRQNALFYKAFDDETYRGQIDGCLNEWDIANTYKAFTVADTKYLLVCLDYGPSDEALEWAGEIIEAHKDHRVIITTHTYLFRDGTLFDKDDAYPASRSQGGVNDGVDMWEKLVKKYENIVLVISGHDPSDHIVCTRTEGDNGNVVTQLLVNPQHMDSSLPYCTNMVAMLYFSEDGKTVTVRYYSIMNNRYGSVQSQFSFDIE